MIKYKMGSWGLRFVFRLRGSVFPKAFVIGLVDMALAVLLHVYVRDEMAADTADNPFELTGFSVVWAGYTSVLSFLLVFRNNQAYTRFWEGASLVNQIRGEWFCCISSLFAFSNQDKDFAPRVQEFQHNLVRLASLLHCSALQQICELYDDCFDVLDFEGMGKESIGFMKMSKDRCEVIVQWMQRLMVDAHEVEILKIPSPLLTRAFQELSRGIVNLNNARKIQEIPFPFPYAQLITCMLLVHGAATPVIASQNIASLAVAAAGTFSLAFVLWCMVFTTMEIDQPFGDDPNDLPLYEMQREFNESLITLMHPLAQKVPEYRRLDAASFMASPARSPLRTSMTEALDTFGATEVVEEVTSSVDSSCIAALARDISVTSPSLRRPTVRMPRSATTRSEAGASCTSSRRRSWPEALAWASSDFAGDLDGEWRSEARSEAASEQGAASGPSAQRLGSRVGAAASATSPPSRKRRGEGGGTVRFAGAAEEAPGVASAVALPAEGGAHARQSADVAEDRPSLGRPTLSPSQSSGSMMSLDHSEVHLPVEEVGRARPQKGELAKQKQKRAPLLGFLGLGRHKQKSAPFEDFLDARPAW